MSRPKQSDPQFKLRMTPEIKEQIEKGTKVSGRSMNAEILAQLQAYPQNRLLSEALSREMSERNRLADENERLGWELEKLKDVQDRFFNKDGSQKPVITLPQELLDRIKEAANRNHRTIDAEALTALEIAYPPKSLDVSLLTDFLASLSGVTASDDDKEYLDYINSALAEAKQPWTVKSGWDGAVSFYPYATQREDPEENEPPTPEKKDD